MRSGCNRLIVAAASVIGITLGLAPGDAKAQDVTVFAAGVDVALGVLSDPVQGAVQWFAGVGHAPTLDEPEVQAAIDRLLAKVG